MRGRTRSRVAVAAVATMALTAACAGGGTGNDDAADAGGAGTAAADGTVEVLVPSEDSGAALTAELERIAGEAGVEIILTSAPAFTMMVQTRVMGNAAPDLVLFPQPFLVLDPRWDGYIRPLDGMVDVDGIEAAMLPGLAVAGRTADGATLGLPVSLGVESLVWYPRAAFEEAGYEVPATHRELAALTERMKDDGRSPWCFGLEEESGKGGPATDWLEEYVLRIGGPEVYDQWVGHRIPFDSEVAIRAGEVVRDLLLSEGAVDGGPRAIAAAGVGDSVAALLADPPGCLLFRQGNSLTEWSGTVRGDLAGDLGWFLLPPYDGGWDGGLPVLGTARFVAAFADDEDVRTVLAAMLSPDFGAHWARDGEFLSPFVGFPAADYPDATRRELAAAMAGADAFRIDGSDRMPGEVGSGSFRSGMTSWVVGEKDLRTALAEIEDTWPEY